jgi:prophage regulatory protein
MDSFFRKAQVREITGLSDTTIWRLEKKGLFPKRRSLSYNTVGWLQSDIFKWVHSRPWRTEK